MTVRIQNAKAKCSVCKKQGDCVKVGIKQLPGKEFYLCNKCRHTLILALNSPSI